MSHISICIATYNGEKYIKDQLDSILVQLDENDEIIISDDCSTDSTLRIVESLNDKRIIILKNSNKFKNYNFNFENALKKASGEIIFLSDQDDIWIENKIQRFLRAFKESKANLVISDCILVDHKGNKIAASLFNLGKSNSGFLKNFYKNSFVGCCMAFDRKVLEASLPFPNNIFSHDTWIGLIAEMIGKTYFLKEPLIYFRRHGENFSTHNSGDTFLTNISPYSFTEKLSLRIKLLKMIILRFIKLQIKS